MHGAHRDAAGAADEDSARMAALRALADEQAALLRVAELVAAGAAESSIFDAVAEEACRLLGGHFTALLRYEPDGPVILAMHGATAVAHVMHIGMRIAAEGDGVVQRVQRTAQAARIDTYETVPGWNAGTARGLGLTSGVGAPIIAEGEVWGAITVLGSGPPLAASAETRLGMFAKLVAMAISNAQARTDLTVLADEQAALRRVAELVAREAPPEAVLEAVAVQASQLSGVDFTTLLRFEPDGSTEIVALDGAPDGVNVGMRAPGGGDGATQRVWRMRRAARMDNLSRASGRWPQVAHGFGFSASAAVPILLERRLWGALVVVARDEPLPPGIEMHLADFAELASTAISAARTRTDLHALAEEQAALRRVAELVARGAVLDEVFAAVAHEASKLLGEMATALLRYDPDDVAVTVAAWNSPAPLGLRIPSGSDTPTGKVLRTGLAVRVDTFTGTSLSDLAEDLGVEAGVAVPVTVEGRVWGALTTSSPGPPLPAGTEERLGQFAELAAAAIANAENKASLSASRARIVDTADETRRRLQRDLHDGAQQRLVHTLLALGLAKQVAADGRPTGELIDEAINHAERANRELRDLVRGILPASLTRGGLRTAVAWLVSDIPLAVDVRVTASRFPPRIETTAYFVVAEALTNVVKHAHATRAIVQIYADDGTLLIEIRDDGCGGADRSHGTGLTGLLDRIEASGGTLRIMSRVGNGTTLHVTLPYQRGA